MRRLLKKIGMRQAVGAHLLGRVWLSIAQLITIGLIADRLSPAEQGYYYTFFGFQSIENLFELGFRLVVLQFASHEAAHLHWTDDLRMEGPEKERRRLGHLMRFSFKFYTGLATAYGILVFAGGCFFFGFFQESKGVAWLGPWGWMMAASALLLFTAPLNMLLEGCGKVDEAYRLRLFMGVTASLATWAVLLNDGKLYATGAYVFGSAAVAIIWILKKYHRFFSEMMSLPKPDEAREFIRGFWKLQNRVAASSIAYFLRTPILAPVAFAVLGETLSGQLGMAVSMATLILTAGSAWIITHAAPMGRLVAQGRFDEVDHELKDTLKKALITAAIASIGALVIVEVLKMRGSSLGHRILPMPELIVLAIGTMFQVSVLAYTYYSRAFKREPLLKMNLVVGALSVVGAIGGAYLGGSFGIVLSYSLLCMFSAVWAHWVVDRQRHEWRSAPPDVDLSEPLQVQ